jgi:hypothetical protein
MRNPTGSTPCRFALLALCNLSDRVIPFSPAIVGARMAILHIACPIASGERYPYGWENRDDPDSELRVAF